MSPRVFGDPPKCGDCDRRLPSSRPRVQEGSSWYCPNCYYNRERSRVLAQTVVPIRANLG